MSSYDTPEFREKVKEVCSTAFSMSEAAKTLKIDYKTLKRYATILGCFTRNSIPGKLSPNKKPPANRIHSTEDILAGLVPQFGTSKLARRLFGEGIKEYKCEICNISSWMDNPISLHIHHLDGNSSNHILENLQVLCPNCHSQTQNYGFKKRSPEVEK